ncbi:hypothetical protein GS506_15965 [Rhodococcus hoagii]|nr:hypothetical protein [Prescottella equi]
MLNTRPGLHRKRTAWQTGPLTVNWGQGAAGTRRVGGTTGGWQSALSG